MEADDGRDGAVDEDAEGGVRLGRITTAVDFHESSSDAALWMMRHLAPDAVHELVHVVELPELPGPLRALGRNREKLRAAAKEAAEVRLRELRGQAAGARVNGHVLEGRPATEIARVADEVGADLIVVGEQGPRRGVTALLGSTAERVLFDARIPVLVARKAPDGPPRRILVAIDDSEMAQRVLAWARGLVERFDAKATVLNVVDRVLLADALTGLPEAGEFQRLESDATAAMQDWLDEAVGTAGLSGSRVQTTVGIGEPSYEIIAEAARGEADLVIIGSRGGDVARTPLIGRIVNKVVRSAPCSVLVVTNSAGGG